MELLGKGVYPLNHAAKLVGADPRSVRRWMHGYERRGQAYEPLWTSELAGADLPTESIGFQDLLELRLVAAFARHGVSVRMIRATVNAARREIGDYPLSTKRFLTDGKRIFHEAIDAEGRSEMVDILKKQFVFASIIRASLYEGIEYDGPNAKRWYPLGRSKKIVMLDPSVQFGAPVVAGAGIPTDTLYAAYVAEGKDRNAVARIYSIQPGEVDAAVRFEQQLAA